MIDTIIEYASAISALHVSLAANIVLLYVLALLAGSLKQARKNDHRDKKGRFKSVKKKKK